MHTKVKTQEAYQPHTSKMTQRKTQPNTTDPQTFQLGAGQPSRVDRRFWHRRESVSQDSFSKAAMLNKAQASPSAKFPRTELRIPPTDPIRTALQWQRVLRSQMSNKRVPRYSRPTAASRKKIVSEQDGSVDVLTLRDMSSQSASHERTRSGSQHTAATSVATSQPSLSIKSRTPKLTDRSFAARIYPAYGIQFESKTELRDPYEHFGTNRPIGITDSEVADWYRKRHPNCDIWLSLDESDAMVVAQQYDNMIAIRSNEAKLSHRGKLYFFKEDEISAPRDSRRGSSSYFELEWAPNPDGRLLLCPPLLDHEGESFNFNTNPDCTYWLTTRRMNNTYRDAISDLTFVLPGANAAAPYLTIEFKKDSADFETALNQLAVSATLVLYNRFRLRCRRLQTRRTHPTMERFLDIKHYGVAFNGSEARFYLIHPVLSTTSIREPEEMWQGCRLVQFRTVDARTTDGVVKIREWINEIHNWGLDRFSAAFVLDIKGILSADVGGERVSLTPQELEALV